MNQTLRRFALLPAMVFATACGDSGSEPRTPSMTGTWVGDLQGAAVTVTLTERDQQVNGAGNIAFGTDRVAITAGGTHVHPAVSLTIKSSGFQDINYQGTFTNDNTVSGSLSGSGFTGDNLIIRRQ